MISGRNDDDLNSLLKRAVGDRTQAQFAREAGISPSWFSRMMNGGEVTRPHVSTLKKVAAAADGGVTLRNLLAACGYPATEATLGEYRSLEERLDACWEDFTSGMKDLIPGSYDDVLGFAEAAYALYGTEDVVITVGDEVKTHQFGAEAACPVTLSFVKGDETARAAFGIFYCHTKGKKVVILGTDNRLKTLLKLGSDVAEELSAFMDDAERVTSVIRDKVSSEQYEDSLKTRILNEIFSDDAFNSLGVEIGIGFYVDNMPMSLVKRFLRNHADAFCLRDAECEVYEKWIASDAELTEDAFAPVKADNDSWETGTWGAAVCNVIYRETGLQLEFWEPAGDEAEVFLDRPVIMFSEKFPWYYNDIERMLVDDTDLIRMLSGYAEELHSEVECCHFIWK